MRVDCVPVSKKVKTHICEELLPTETVINLHNLCEHTEYDITVTAVTEEYFESLPVGHEWKKERQIPYSNKVIPDSEWLPKSLITVSTLFTLFSYFHHSLLVLFISHFYHLYNRNNL